MEKCELELNLFTLPWIASAKEQVEKNNSRIQGQVRCTLQDVVCIKCEDKSFLSPMSVDNFLKAVFESCYVVFVASRVVNLYTSFHHRMSLLSWQMFTRETHRSGQFIVYISELCLGYIEALPTSLFCNVSVLWRCFAFDFFSCFNVRYGSWLFLFYFFSFEKFCTKVKCCFKITFKSLCWLIQKAERWDPSCLHTVYCTCCM